MHVANWSESVGVCAWSIGTKAAAETMACKSRDPGDSFSLSSGERAGVKASVNTEIRPNASVADPAAPGEKNKNKCDVM